MFFNTEKKRFRKVENDFEHFTRVASMESVRRALGEKASTLLAHADDFFVPNFRNGVVTIPKQYREKGVAVLPVKHREAVGLSSDFTSFTPCQRDVVIAKLAACGLNDPEGQMGRIEQELNKLDTPANTSLRFTAEITSFSRYVSVVEDKYPMIALGRPLMLLDAKQAHPPSVIGHELMHIVQHVNSSLAEVEFPDVEEATPRELREFEAHEAGAVLERFEGLGLDRQQSFDNARKRFMNLERPFEVSEELRNFLEENGFRGWNGEQ